MKLGLLAVTVVGLFLWGSENASADWVRVPGSWTNSQGYRISSYTARVSGSGCEGGQRYVKLNNPSDSGTSARRWTTATRQDGGTVCSGGSWYYGGSRAGQVGGAEADVLIKGGAVYKRGR